MPTPLRILLIEDSADDADLLLCEVRRGGYAPEWERVETPAALAGALARQEWDLITCDWVVPGVDATQALRLIRQLRSDVPVIIVSGEVAEEVAVTAMKAGAADFVCKQRLARLLPVVGRELRDAEVRRARQRAEKAPIDSERKFRSLIENASDLISVMDETGIIRYASPSHERALGYAPEELIGKCAFDFVHPDDFGGVVQSYHESVVNRDPARRAEFRFRHRDGSWRVFEGVAKVALDDPDVQGVIVTTRDIGDRKRVEEALRRRVEFERLMSLISTTFIRLPFDELDRAIHDALRIIGRFAAADSAYIALFSADRTTWHVSHEWDADGLPSLAGGFEAVPIGLFPFWMGRILQGDTVHISNIAALESEANAERDMLLALGVRAVLAVPMVSANGALGFLGFGATHAQRWTDDEVTLIRLAGEMFANALDRRRIEVALRHSEQRFRSLCDSSPVGICETDATGTCLYANPRFQEITGLTLEQSLSDGWKTALHPDDREATLNEWTRCVRSGVEYSHSARVVTPQGSVRWTQTCAAPIHAESGALAGFVATVEDVTMRQRAEMELRRVQHLEAVAQLASGVAHYFNNQLTVIKGAAQFLLRDLPATDARRLDAELISTTADRCARMVDQLTFFGRWQPQEAPSLNLNTVVHELVPTLRGLLGKRIALRVRTEADLRPVRGHRSQLEHVVLQLVTNARDALAQNGNPAAGDAVTIETANVEADQTSAATPTSGLHVLLAVSDNGPGITPEVRQRLFEPFFTTKAVGQGTGLGLATVFGIVRHHNGSVVCLSELGQGAAFRVYLPAAGVE